MNSACSAGKDSKYFSSRFVPEDVWELFSLLVVLFGFLLLNISYFALLFGILESPLKKIVGILICSVSHLQEMNQKWFNATFVLFGIKDLSPWYKCRFLSVSLKKNPVFGLLVGCAAGRASHSTVP